MIWLNQGERDGTQASGGMDGAPDAQNLEAFAQQHHLKMGSTFFSVDESKVYMQKSDGTFKKIGG